MPVNRPRATIRREDDTFAPVRQRGVVGVLDRISGHVVRPDVSEGWRPADRGRQGRDGIGCAAGIATASTPCAAAASAPPAPPDLPARRAASPPAAPDRSAPPPLKDSPQLRGQARLRGRPARQPAVARRSHEPARAESVRRQPGCAPLQWTTGESGILTGLPDSLTFAGRRRQVDRIGGRLRVRRRGPQHRTGKHATPIAQRPQPCRPAARSFIDSGSSP